MFRALALTVAFGLTPAFAEDAPVLDGLPVCDGTCPEPMITAMSSDLDGDGEAEYFDLTALDAEVTLATAVCGPDTRATCSTAIDAGPDAADPRL